MCIRQVCSTCTIILVLELMISRRLIVLWLLALETIRLLGSMNAFSFQWRQLHGRSWSFFTPIGPYSLVPPENGLRSASILLSISHNQYAYIDSAVGASTYPHRASGRQPRLHLRISDPICTGCRYSNSKIIRTKRSRCSCSAQKPERESPEWNSEIHRYGNHGPTSTASPYEWFREVGSKDLWKIHRSGIGRWGRKRHCSSSEYLRNISWKSMQIVFQGLIRALEESGIPIDQIGGWTVS